MLMFSGCSCFNHLWWWWKILSMDNIVKAAKLLRVDKKKELFHDYWIERYNKFSANSTTGVLLFKLLLKKIFTIRYQYIVGFSSVTARKNVQNIPNNQQRFLNCYLCWSTSIGSGYCLIRGERMVIFMAVRVLLSNINIIAKYEKNNVFFSFCVYYKVEVKIVTCIQ